MRITLSPTATLFHADCREALRELPSDSLDAVVTDPPYALVSTVKRFANSPRTEASMPTAGPYERASRGFMGQRWDTGETAFSTEFWQQVYRVLKPGAFVAAFGASRGYHRMACAIEDAGFEIRDSLMWIYATGFPKSQNVAKFIDKELGAEGETVATGEAVKRMIPGADQNKDGWIKDDGREFVPHDYAPGSPQAQEFEGFGTALKPAFEPIVLARKPLSEGTVAANVLKWRTGALNIDGCRVPTTENLNGGAYSGGSKKLADATSYATGVNAGEYVQPEGRWPANVVTDGSDEVVGMFPQSAGQLAPISTRPGTKTSNVYGKMNREGEASADRRYTERGSTNFAAAPGQRREPAASAARFFYSAKASRADRNGSKHPTVKPIALMQWLARLITPPGGAILDPFAGSGTTGAAAALEGFRVVLCEREAEYVRDIRARFPSATKPRLVLPLERFRQELALLPAVEALRARLRA